MRHATPGRRASFISSGLWGAQERAKCGGKAYRNMGRRDRSSRRNPRRLAVSARAAPAGRSAGRAAEQAGLTSRLRMRASRHRSTTKMCGRVQLRRHARSQPRGEINHHGGVLHERSPRRVVLATREEHARADAARVPAATSCPLLVHAGKSAPGMFHPCGVPALVRGQRDRVA
jgi:hypothetical protein